MATCIGFTGLDIKILTDFIDFRRAYKELSDEELEAIIDNPTLDLKIKLALAKKLTKGHIKLLLDTIQTVQHSWNKMFDNKKYQHIKNKFETNIK